MATFYPCPHGNNWFYSEWAYSINERFNKRSDLILRNSGDMSSFRKEFWAKNPKPQFYEISANLSNGHSVSETVRAIDEDDVRSCARDILMHISGVSAEMIVDISIRPDF